MEYARSYAETLKSKVQQDREIRRLEHLFLANPSGTYETTLDVATATHMGFSVAHSYQGTYVALPNTFNSQFADH